MTSSRKEWETRQLPHDHLVTTIHAPSGKRWLERLDALYTGIARIIHDIDTLTRTHYDPDTYRHACRVAERFDTGSLLWVGAMCHDLIEDTPGTYDDLLIFETRDGLHGLLSIIDHVTRRQSETYAAYILRCKNNPDAVRIKLADLTDHFDQSATLTPSLKKRYTKAWDTLTRD